MYLQLPPPLQTPQAPIARTNKYNEYNMDEYPNGTNAVVAVLAHTGGALLAHTGGALLAHTGAVGLE